jgi:hypothetical protein
LSRRGRLSVSGEQAEIDSLREELQVQKQKAEELLGTERSVADSEQRHAQDTLELESALEGLRRQERINAEFESLAAGWRS